MLERPSSKDLEQQKSVSMSEAAMSVTLASEIKVEINNDFEADDISSLVTFSGDDLTDNGSNRSNKSDFDDLGKDYACQFEVINT